MAAIGDAEREEIAIRCGGEDGPGYLTVAKCFAVQLGEAELTQERQDVLK
jgi:hypothetical protein